MKATPIKQNDKVYSSRKNYEQGYIYKIVNNKNNKLYIGSTINFHKRKAEHISGLKGNRHYNKHLQNAWNKYGESIFIFEVIENISDVNTLAEREQYWMDFYKSYEPDKGYNINKSATSSLGRPVTDETKNKIRMAHINSERYGENHHSYGKKLSTETKQKISETSKNRIATKETRKQLSESITGIFKGEKHPKAKLTEDQVIEIKLLRKITGMSASKIALIYNVSKSCINNIIYDYKWTHITIDDTMKLPEHLLIYINGDD